MSILETKVSPCNIGPECEALAIDGAFLIHNLTPTSGKTFYQYAIQDVVPRIEQYGSKYQRTDVIFDVYVSQSLKAETRSKRGHRNRRRVTGNGKVPPNWKGFLRNEENKTELFLFHADELVKHCNKSQVVVTKGDTVVCNTSCDVDCLDEFNHAEADTRLFVHVTDMVRH